MKPLEFYTKYLSIVVHSMHYIQFLTEINSINEHAKDDAHNIISDIPIQQKSAELSVKFWTH